MQIYESNNGRRQLKSYINEIYESKYILYEFFKRDIKSLYSQSLAGPIFLIFLPMIQSGVFHFFLTMFSVAENNIENFLIVFFQMLFWNLFSQNVIKGSNVFLVNRKLLNKVYFPRIIYFFSPFITHLFHFMFQFILFFGLFVFFKLNFIVDFSILIKFLIVPILLAYLFLLYLSISLIIASISIKYRDIAYLAPYIFQLLIFLSPVFFSLQAVDENFRFLFSLNPYCIVAESLRWIYQDNFLISINVFIINLIITFILLILSLIVFYKQDKFIADLV